MGYKEKLKEDSNLEEIFFKEGELVNEKGKKVKPKLVTPPKIICCGTDPDTIYRRIIETLNFEDHEEGNAYLIGKQRKIEEARPIQTSVYYYPVVFCKI
jgi:hypothetical protein